MVLNTFGGLCDLVGRHRSSVVMRLLATVFLFSCTVTLTLTALQLYRDYNRGVMLIESRLSEIDGSYRGSLGEALLWGLAGADVAERAAPLPSFGAGPIIQDMIAIEKVRHYGETVAAVIAENRYVAEDACDLVEVVYEQLPVVLDPREAPKDGAPLVHEQLGTIGRREELLRHETHAVKRGAEETERDENRDPARPHRHHEKAAKRAHDRTRLAQLPYVRLPLIPKGE